MVDSTVLAEIGIGEECGCNRMRGVLINATWRQKRGVPLIFVCRVGDIDTIRYLGWAEQRS